MRRSKNEEENREEEEAGKAETKGVGRRRKCLEGNRTARERFLGS